MKKPPQSQMTQNSEKNFFGHLDELTNVLFKVGSISGVSALLVFAFTSRLFYLIISRSGLNLITTAPTELLMLQINFALLGGLILASPVTAPILWSYIKPALSQKELRAISMALIPSLILFSAGFAFSYLVIIPLTLNFLLELAIDSGINAFWTVSSYISLVLSFGFAFGMAFQLPTVIFVLSKLGIVSYSGLKHVRKYIIVAIFILAAILTPPDAISQLLLAIPLVILFEISILITRFTQR